MRKFASALALIAALTLTSAGEAAYVKWQLDAVVDTVPGSIVTGYFEFDKGTGSFGDFDLALSGVPATYAGSVSGNVSLGYASATTSSGTVALDLPALYLAYPLASLQSQAAATLTPVSFVQFNHVPYIPTPYTISGTARELPEPATWAMLMTGFLGIGFVLRGQSTVRRASAFGPALARA